MVTTVLSNVSNRVAVWTYMLLALSFVPTVLGVMFGPAKGSFVMALVLLAVAIGLMIAAIKVSQDAPVAGSLLFLAFAFVEGTSIAPLISHYMASGTGQAAVLKAFISTGVIFFGLTLWTWIKGFDAKSWGPYLFVALLALLAVMVLSLFFPTTIAQTAISYCAVLLFSLYIVYDTSEVIHGRQTNPVFAAISLYLDVLNIFIHLLQLFGNSSDD